MNESTFRHALIAFGNPNWAQQSAQNVYNSCATLAFDHVDKFSGLTDFMNIHRPDNVSDDVIVMLYFAGEMIPDECGNITLHLQNGDNVLLTNELWITVKSLVEYYASKKVQVTVVAMWDVVRCSRTSSSHQAFTKQCLGNVALSLVDTLPCECFWAHSCEDKNDDGQSSYFTQALLEGSLRADRPCKLADAIHEISVLSMFHKPGVSVTTICKTMQTLILNP